MKSNLKKIVDHFNMPGEFIEARSYGTGHINDTYLIDYQLNSHNGKTVIQRINHEVFREPLKMMDNIVRVTNHLRVKLAHRYPDDIHRRVLTAIPTRDDRFCYQDEEGNFWRGFEFIDRARTWDVLQSLDQAYQAAKAFGEFQTLLGDLPQPKLHETIPDFHNGPKRYRDFMEVLEKDPCNRARKAYKEIEFLQEQEATFEVVPQLLESGAIPLRTTHNDTKINNVLLDDRSGEGVCVLDLDTTMPGVSLYDFGDIVRTTVSSAAEDETDLSKICVDMERFGAIVKGFLAGAGGGLNRTEVEYLVFGGKLLTLIIGTRFLTDYLAGDRYYKIHHEGHNLQRCRAQFKLVQSIIDHEDIMNRQVERIHSQIVPVNVEDRQEKSDNLKKKNASSDLPIN